MQTMCNIIGPKTPFDSRQRPYKNYQLSGDRRYHSHFIFLVGLLSSKDGNRAHKFEANSKQIQTIRGRNRISRYVARGIPIALCDLKGTPFSVL